MLDQILTNPVIRVAAFGLAGALLVAVGWGAAIIWAVEPRYRAQRKADRIAEQMRAGRELRGGAMSRPDSTCWPGIVSALFLLALVALDVAIMMEVGR